MTTTIHAAMAAQLDRVNTGGTARPRIADLEAENARLRTRLQAARDRVRALEAQLSAHQATAPAPDADAPAATMLYKGRPATTPQRAAAFYGVHASTINRRLHAGKIKGEQLPGSNRWVVFLDAPIAPFRRSK